MLLALLAALGWSILPRDTTKPVPVDEAIAAFRTESGATTAPGTELPAPGVYTYATAGRESVDALTGAEHVYPRLTTLTVTHGACGLTLRWNPLEGRSTTWDVCPSPGPWALRSVSERHTFFGRPEDTVYRCRGDLFRPGTAAWRGRCTADGTTDVRSGEVVGDETLRVGGRSVAVVHVRVRTTLSGETRGTTVKEMWLLRTTGLPVRHVERNATTTRTLVGEVHYRERFELTLTSLEPRR